MAGILKVILNYLWWPVKIGEVLFEETKLSRIPLPVQLLRLIKLSILNRGAQDGVVCLSDVDTYWYLWKQRLMVVTKGFEKADRSLTLWKKTALILNSMYWYQSLFVSDNVVYSLLINIIQ